MNPHPNARILYLDDNADWRKQIGGLLRENGYTVEDYSATDDVRKAFKSQTSFDLAVLDMRLDETDGNDETGLELAFELRDKFDLTLPVIILSSYSTNNKRFKRLSRYPYRFQFLEKGNVSSSDSNGLLPCIKATLPMPISPTIQYDNFDLLIGWHPDGVRIHVLNSPQGNCEEIISEFHRSIYSIDIDNISSIAGLDEEIGSHLLYQCAKEVWLACLAGVKPDEQGLRIRIRMHDDDLVQIPWEMAKISGKWPALNPTTPMVRYISATRKFGSIPVQGKLRILGLVGEPHLFPNDTPLDLESEKKLLKSALDPLIKRGQVQLEWLERMEILDKLQNTLRRWKPHVIHYLGHGLYDDIEKKSGLLLGHTDDGPQNLGSQELGMLLEGSTVRFALFNACQTGHPLGGVALELVKTCIPAALGMQAEIPDDVAIDFARTFYQSLADFLPIEVAATEGRRRLATKLGMDDPRWALPVLYMHADDGRLFTRTS